MTKYRKKRLIEDWQRISQQIDRRDNGLTLEKIEQMQAEIINFGETVEKMISSDSLSAIVRELEVLCEGLYVLSQKLNSADQEQEIYDICSQNEKIIYMLDNLETKKLAVFLPYKYSMWDSLESIYLAAAADPEWDALVVPIPYADLGTDGSVTKVVYEGDCFTNIPIHDFNDFSIEEIHPDVTYVHNPYDGFNKVTTILPDFYSESIRQFTEKLVYVPYFFTGNVMPDAHCNIPTYKLFDYIVVPSEFSKKQVAAHIGDEKVLALGSPKIDSIINMQKKRELPKEWSEKIGEKKVVLYNNSLNSLINLRFHDILKMRQVFDYFKKNREMLLWWRPHPLMKSTIKSMCPELLGAYEEMEKAFLIEKIGIYDTTEDSNRAIACADAFLGDSSSMQNLFALLGKPIFLLDDFVTNEPEQEEKLIMYPTFPPNCLDHEYDKWISWPLWTDKDETFFWDWTNRCICSLDRACKAVKVIEKINQDISGFWVEHADDKDNCAFRFFPRYKEGPVLIYNIKTQKWSEDYSDPVLQVELEKQGGLTLYKDKVYIFPGRNNQLIIIDRITGEIKSYECNTAELERYRLLPGENLLMNGMVVHGIIYMLSVRTNKVLSFDTNTCKFKMHSIGDENIPFGNYWYVSDTNCMWFVAWNGSSVIRWNLDTDKKDCFPIKIPGYIARLSIFDGTNRPAFNRITWWKNELILVPCLANMFLKVDMETGEVKEWKLKLPFEIGQRKSSAYTLHDNFGWSIYPDETHMLVQSNYDGSMLLIDLETSEVELYHLKMSEAEYMKFSKPAKERSYLTESGSYVFFEDAIHFPLKDMMNFFQHATNEDIQAERQRTRSSKGIINVDGSCGSKIHQFIDSAVM